MKKNLFVLTLTLVLLTSCAGAPPELVGEEIQQQVGEELQLDGPDEAGPGTETHAGTLEALDGTVFTEGEIAGVLFMCEEEKLARDVYRELADLWGMNIFSNIGRSEDTHMGAVLTLLELAGLDDPAAGMDRGEFLDQDLQRMYDELAGRGAASLEEALLVGAAIEEIDILDLQVHLDRAENPAVVEVFQSLLQGSINHLNAFVRAYERQAGEEYQPQYLSVQAFDELLSSGGSQGGGLVQGWGDQSGSGGRGRAR